MPTSTPSCYTVCTPRREATTELLRRPWLGSYLNCMPFEGSHLWSWLLGAGAPCNPIGALSVGPNLIPMSGVQTPGTGDEIADGVEAAAIGGGATFALVGIGAASGSDAFF